MLFLCLTGSNSSLFKNGYFITGLLSPVNDDSFNMILPFNIKQSHDKTVFSSKTIKSKGT